MPTKWTADSLNQHLSTSSYVGGFFPSMADAEALAQFGDAVTISASAHPHLARWRSHIEHLKLNPDCIRIGGLGSPGVKSAVATQRQPPVAPAAASAGAAAKHGFRDSTICEKLARVGVAITADPIAKRNAAGRLEGHSTHNYFMHDKKDKTKLLLVTLPQSSNIDLKKLAALLKLKEVRFCSEGESLLGSQKGCVTPLSLIYDEDRKVEWVVEATLLEDSCWPWRLGTSPDDCDPSDITVADVPKQALESLLSPAGHWDSKHVVSL
eukprot:TRINITY_DN83178_c0_g1_i1.p1 TRINITY_DN83178_c0_g1~~TRINITY_DN83178_c0_g1_i1.p1  ORF type:complete len:267 (-),score=38.18 TRINITY_DN83178_c0_g1_i1:163-963(-)